jgi:hypothetical protein
VDVASAEHTAASDAAPVGQPVGGALRAWSPGSVVRAVVRHIGLVLLFSVPAVILWWHVWDAHPASTVSCPCFDSGQQIWFISWPAYALDHGLLPFFTSSLWTPAGVNLLNNTSAPLAGTVLAPITWLFGPIVSNNVALTLAPGLTAWSCWLACRRFVDWAPAAVLGGLLFGYSPFAVTAVGFGHLSIALLVVPPLTLVVLHELFVRQRPQPWVVGLMLGALVCAQFMISVEVLAIMGIVVVGGVVVAALLSWSQVRAVLPYAVRALAVAAGLVVVVLAWPSWYLLAGPRHFNGAPFPGIEGAANGRLFHLWSAGASSIALPVPGSASGVVVGPPADFTGIGVVVLALASLVVARRRKVAWIMALVALGCVVLSWGPTLWITSTHAVSGPWLPWRTLDRLPIFRNILPIRFAIFTDLATAMLIAVGLDTARTWPGWSRLDSRMGRRHDTHGPSTTAGAGSSPPVGVVFIVVSCIVAAVVLVPQWVNYQVPIATQRVVLPSWFATVGRTVRPGSTVLTYPFPDVVHRGVPAHGVAGRRWHALPVGRRVRQGSRSGWTSPHHRSSGLGRSAPLRPDHRGRHRARGHPAAVPALGPPGVERLVDRGDRHRTPAGTGRRRVHRGHGPASDGQPRRLGVERGRRGADSGPPGHGRGPGPRQLYRSERRGGVRNGRRPLPEGQPMCSRSNGPSARGVLVVG